MLFDEMTFYEIVGGFDEKGNKAPFLIRFILKSDNNDFIHNVHDAIVDAMNSKKVNYTIKYIYIT